MPFPSLTEAPTAPTRSMTNDEFIEAADAFVAWIAVFRDEVTEWAEYCATLAASLGVSSADAELQAFAGLASAADKLGYFTGSGTMSLADFTSVARTLVAQSTQALMRTTGLGMSANGSSLVAAADYSAMRTLLSVYSVAQVDSAIAAINSVPTGAVQAFARNTAPAGWLECDGAAVSRTTYATLFTAIGTTFGSGDGSTTFNVPDLRGEFLRGWDHGKGTDSGRSFGSSQADELKAHTHTITSGVGSTQLESGQGGIGSSFNTGSTGGAETRPRNIALLYAVKT